MINKLLKFSIIFLVILGISFSNIPFYAITGLIDSYVKTIGVVDKIWLVQQEGDSNIVDKFISFRTIVRKLEIQKAQAAITYQTPGAIAYSASGGTSVSPAYPASIAANNLLVLIIGMKPSTANGGSVTTPSGWTPIISLTGAGGYGTTLGADTGNTNIFTYYTVAAGGESGSLAVTIDINGVSWAQMYRYTNASGSWSVAGTTGSDTAGGNVSIAFGANPGVTTGDNILAAMVIPTDVTTPTQFSAEAFTQTGVTFNAVTEISEPDSNAGNDIGGFVARTSVSSGTASANPTMTATAGGTTTNVRGPGVFIRIREANTAPTLTITQPDGTGDTVNAGDLYNITYDLADTDPLHAVTVAMYYDTDAVGLNGTAITGACATAAEGVGATCSWDTTGMTPGAYYVYGITNDGIAAQVSDYSPGVITINASNILTIGVTAGSKVSTVNSGDSSVYANTASCAASSTCAAFTLLVSNTSVTVSSIGITETGTVNASSDLSNLALFYDTDGNYSNGVTGQYGSTVASFTSEIATTTGSLALTAGTTYYFYVRFNASSTATYPKGGQTVNFQIANNNSVTLSSGSATISGAPVSLAGTTTILPKVSSVTYGAGLSDGVRSSEAITISGYGFGVAPGGSRANCAGAVDTGCVRFLVGGAATVADSSVSSWSNISIGWTASSTLATLGGVSSLEVVSGSQGTATDTTYYVYPNIAAISVTGAREYDAGDTDGLVMLSGDHFGSTQGTVSSTGAFGNGNLAIHSTAEGSCSTGGWSAASYSGNTVCIEITSSSISDSVYSGSITLNRNSDLKTDIESNFNIMPRIISNTPANGVVSDIIQIKGNHFCQSGTCPVSPNRSDSNDNVKFGNTTSTDGDFVNQTGGAGTCNGAGAAWAHAEICVRVPSGIPTGSQPTKVRTNTIYDSNIKAFTVNSTTPNDPVNLNQFKENGTTVISAGGTTASSTVIFKATSTASLSINMLLQVEVKATSTAFDGVGIIDGPICVGCTSTSTAVKVTGLSDGSKHWRARTKNSSTSEVSAWVYYGTSDINEIDFIIDTIAPTITFPSPDGGPPGCSNSVDQLVSNRARITWSLNEIADGQIEYSTSSDLTGSINYPSSPNASTTSHQLTLSNLNSNTTYYFKVKSRDGAGNLANRPISAPYCSFLTYSVTQPVKTTTFHATSTPGVISGGSISTSTFSIHISEATSTVLIKSAFLEITGLVSGGTNPIDIKVNDVATKSYNVNATNPTHFRFIYIIPIPDPLPETRLNLNDIAPCTNGNPSGTDPCNKLVITTGTGMSINIASAKIIVTYAYTP